MPKVDADVALEIASHEAIIRQTYKDGGGVNTWSVGLTNATGHNVDRYIGKPQPLQYCIDVYVWALKNYAKQVDEAFKGVTLNKAQYAAACSFHWNTGRIKKASWVKYFKEGKIAKARKAFMTFNKPSSIIPRREKECELFFDGVWSNDGRITEYTRLTKNMTPVWSSARRIDITKEIKNAFVKPVTKLEPVIDTAPVPDSKPTMPTLSPDASEGYDKPLSQSRTIRGSMVSGVGLTGTTITETISSATDQISPLTEYSQTLKMLFVGLTLLGVGWMVYAKLNDVGKIK